jgi:starch synthase
VKILMVTSEATPFAKSGGLADAAAALSAALAAEGHDVRIVMPRYYSIDKSKLKHLPGPLGIPVGWEEQWAALYETELPGTSVPVYLIDHERSFGRDGIYGIPSEPDFVDNPQRFAVLCRGAYQACLRLGWTPDVVHAHDWPAAAALAYRDLLPEELGFKRCATVFTIHNLGYQGVYHKDSFPYFRMPWESFHGSGFEHFDRINLLKAGVHCADMISTVSPTYAREVQTPEHGFGMDGLLRVRSHDLVGILNGVDYREWNPQTDKHLPAKYGLKDLSGKLECKRALQARYGLEKSDEKPLIGMVSRLTDQKGVGELFGPAYGSAWRICTEMDCQFVVVGSGDAWCERELVSLQSRLPNFRCTIGYDNSLAHLVEAGADFFMMPSRYEPCGLNQLYSLKYGTLPIVHRTGGLADTIESYDQDTGAGTGFSFEHLSPRSIFDTTGWAVWAWYNRPEQIDAMRRRAMGLDFSWDSSAREYEALYKAALAKKGR